MPAQIKSSFDGFFKIGSLALIPSTIYLYFGDVNFKTYFYFFLFNLIFFGSQIIYYSHLIELGDNEVTIKNRFFSFIKPKKVKYEDLFVEYEHGEAFTASVYISLVNYAVTFRLAFTEVSFDYVKKVFEPHGVRCIKK